MGALLWRYFDRVVPVLAILIAAWALTVADSAVRASTDRSRQSCERENVMRENQAGAIQEQIDQTRRNLMGDLGALEPFREQIEDSVDLRVRRLLRLQESVADHPVRDRPYAVDCEAAFP